MVNTIRTLGEMLNYNTAKLVHSKIVNLRCSENIMF